MVSLFRFSAVVVCLLLAALVGRADDKAALERKAKAILALSAPQAKATPAPAPRVAGPRDYSSGHAKAMVDQKPLVVFVGCEVQTCEGAICSKVDGMTFGHVTGPAVVVGYPQGQTLYIDSTLPCPAMPVDLARAVKSAAGKIDHPPTQAMPKAPKPDEWKISADVPGCCCGDACKCKPGDCPGKCCGVVEVKEPPKKKVLKMFKVEVHDAYGRVVQRWYEWREVEEAPPPPPVQPGFQLQPQERQFYAAAPCPQFR